MSKIGQASCSHSGRHQRAKAARNSVIRSKRSLGDGFGARIKRNYDRDPTFHRGEGYAPSRKLSGEDIRKLEAIYGADAVRMHYHDFEKAQELSQYGAHEHKIPWRNMPDNQQVVGLDKESRNDAKLSALNFEPIPPKVIVVDAAEPQSPSDLQEPLITDYVHHCNIHGLWMSSVAGVAIELLPIVQESGRIEIRTKIFDLPDAPSAKGILTSRWTGSGIISPESPTTMTIVFQEHISEIGNYDNAPVPTNKLVENEIVKLPRTAVFVGQCLVCENSPVLQGTWTVFANTQSCARGKNETKKSLRNGEEEEVTSNRPEPETLQLITISPLNLI